MKKLAQCILLAFVATIAFSSAYADWNCKATNRHGTSWTANGYSRDNAVKHAMRICRSYSKHCAITYCGHNGNAYQPAQNNYPQPNRWACIAGNRSFMGTGPNKDSARDNARAVCYRGTGGTGGCEIKSCFIRSL